MPLSNVERQVLELICDEHRQTRRGAKEKIVLIGMNAANHQQKARIVDVLRALKKRGLLVAGADSWVPTSKGEAALTDVDDTNVVDIVAEVKQAEAPKHCDECKAVLTPDEVEFLESSCSACETKALHVTEAQELSGTVGRIVAPLPGFSATLERIGAPLPDDLLNRCAAMNATLLAQAKQAHEAGEPEAWRDLHWLMETAQQLVALGGEA